MASTSTYTLGEVLAASKLHPFYSDAQYPPDNKTLYEYRLQAAAQNENAQTDLRKQPLLIKNNLYTLTERLIHDLNPDNRYRHSAYTSVTGGGGNLKPLFFATCASENRSQRAQFGRFLRTLGLIQPGDWVLTTHVGGDLYRSLDLVLEILENAGATVLAAGHLMPASRVVQLLRDYHINILAGDGSQIIQVVHFIASLGPERPGDFQLDKVIYTSEALTEAQKAYIRKVLGPGIQICSILGSAEAGPYAASVPSIVDPSSGGSDHDSHEPVAAGFTDFVIDTRANLIEIFPSPLPDAYYPPLSAPLADGQTGMVVQTSLSRLRNPLVRYVTGDIGSLQSLPESSRASIPEADWPHLRILRLQGRDAGSSFTWDGEYIELARLRTLLSGPDHGVLQWQVILDQLVPSQEVSLEIRLLCAETREKHTARESVVATIRDFFYLHPVNEHRFKITFVEDRTGFVLSSTGQKVVQVLDRSKR